MDANKISWVASMRPDLPMCGRLLQGPDFHIQLAHGRLAVVRLVFFQIVADVLKVLGGERRTPNAHLCAQHLFKPGVYVGFFDELATAGGAFGFEHSGPKIGVIDKLQAASLTSCSRCRWLSQPVRSVLPARA